LPQNKAWLLIRLIIRQPHGQNMYRNKAVLEAIRRVLASRQMTMDQWEDSIGWPRGTMLTSLQPPEELSINRNIKLPAEHLGIDGAEFFELVRTIDAELGERRARSHYSSSRQMSANGDSCLVPVTWLNDTIGLTLPVTDGF
jgi:hypothetical protein